MTFRYKWQAIFVGIMMCSRLLVAQAQGCETCLFATIHPATSPTATIYATWQEEGQPQSGIFSWMLGDTITIRCHEDLAPLPGASFAVTPNGDTLEVALWTTTQTPTYELDFVVTDDPTLIRVRDTVYMGDCRATVTVYHYTPPNENFACDKVIYSSGGGYRHGMDFPLGSGENITIDFMAYGIPDTLTILAAGQVIFEAPIGTDNGNAFPNNVTWRNGETTPFTGNSPIHGDGFVRVILDVEDNCDLKVIARSNKSNLTAWQLYVHCCTDCYEPPLKTAEIDTTICFSGMVNNTLVAEDTILSRLDLTQGGCDSITVYNIHVAKPAVDSIVTVDASCFGFTDGTATVFATAEMPTFRWSNQVDRAENNGLGAGSYQLTVTDQYGCTVTAAATIHEPPLLEGTLSAIEPRCYGEQNGELTISPIGGSPPYDLRWSNGRTESSIDSLFSGEYTVSITDGQECIEVIPFFLDQPDTLITNIGFVDPTCVGIPDGEAWAETQGGTLPYAYSWSTQNSSSALYDLLSGPYALTATDSNGCLDSSSEVLRSQEPDRTYVPTAFSPDFNYVNDRFLPYSGECVVKIINFQVFDRWGAQLFVNYDFQPNDEQEGWDGLFHGKEMKAGVYVWYLEVEYYSGKIDLLEGEVVLMR